MKIWHDYNGEINLGKLIGDKDEEDAIEQLLEWVDIEEYDDIKFKELLFRAITRQDKDRRFEIHNSDLIYCLRSSFGYKVLPQIYTENEYYRILTWMRGKGIEIGITNAISGLLTHEEHDEDIEIQKVHHLGDAKGTADLGLFGHTYEMTAMMSYGSYNNPKIWPPSYKVVQLITYLVGSNKPDGSVKVFVMLPPRESIKSNIVHKHLGILDTTIQRPERTWLVRFKPGAAQHFMTLFTNRASHLGYALETGKWQSLPMAFYRWRCKRCDMCMFMKTHEEEVMEAWRNWKKLKARYDQIHQNG